MFQENLVSHSLIGLMRGSSWTMRGIASVVILTFGSLVTAPAVAAVKQEIKEIQWHKRDATNAAKLSAKVEEAHQVLTRLSSRGSKGLDLKASHAQIHALKADLEALDKGAMQNFAANEDLIGAHNLSQVTEQRQQEAVKIYRGRMDKLLAELTAADASKDSATFMAHVTNAKAHLDEVQVKPFHEKFDPKNLPFSVAKATRVKPRLSKKDYQARPVASPKRAQVAAIGALAGILTAADVTGALPSNPSDPSYIAATDDAQITPAIQAQAAALHNDPVQIYNWVRNNIEYVPTYGSIQGSDLTLQNLKGNDFDQASLLIALLRASNVPARYVYGTVQLPVVQLENWVGVADPNGAMNLLAQGGIPTKAVVQGGQIKYGQLEHVWVEAWVNFVPSRAAKSGAGNTWVPMDASFKQYGPGASSNPSDFAPAPTTTIGALAAAGVQSNSAGSPVTGVDYWGVLNTIADYQDTVQQTIAANPQLSTSVLIPTRPISAVNRTQLSASLPYIVTARGQAFTAVPTNFEYSVSISLFNTAMDQASDNPTATVFLKLSTLGTKRLSIDYLPATPADEAALSAFTSDQTTTSLPAYLVNVYGSISLDGQVLGQSGPVTMGTQQYVTVGIQEPNDSVSGSYSITAGDETVVGIDAGGISNSAVSARAQSVDTSTAGENLQQVSLTYWMLQDTLMEYLAEQRHLGSHRAPSAGLFSAPLTVKYAFGVPQSGYYHGRQMDVKNNRIAVSGGTPADRFNYTQTVGILGSYLEGATFDMLMGYGPGWSVSSIQYLLNANNTNMPIYAITPENSSTVLPLLSVTSDVTTDISNALNAGLHVVTHQSQIAGGGSGELGQGYIMYDPNTGAGAYQVSTGLSGGASQDCGEPQKTPLQQIIQELLWAIVIASAISLIVMSGGLLAGGLAAGGATVGAAASEGLSYLLTSLGISGAFFAETAAAAGNSQCMGSISVQLQTGKLTLSPGPVMNEDPPGVTTFQVVAALRELYIMRVNVRSWFPKENDAWLAQAIEDMAVRVETVPASGGWIGGGQNLRTLSPDGTYRLDVQNNRGHNLRE